MSQELSVRIAEHFQELTDPRRREVTYPLVNMVVMALCAVLSGADDFVSIARWAEKKQDWLAKFLDMSAGVPSHDRFNAVLGALKPAEFETCLLSWITAIHEITDGQVIAIDGKTLRGSFDAASSKAAIPKALGLPYVEVRHSTGGNGLHLYVHLDVATANHAEHAAVARCVLEKMGVDTGFDFKSHVDCCGGNMWIWRAGLDANHRGLSLIKAADQALNATDVSTWRDHIEVVQKRRTSVRVAGLDDDGQQRLDEMTSSRKRVSLDDLHRSIIDALCESGYSTLWVDDHGLLQTHTQALADVHALLGLKGLYSTSSAAGDPATPNCFMFPVEGGAWRVFRFGLGTSENAIWNQDGQGWTWCAYNTVPTLCQAALELGGIEDPANGEFVFDADAFAQTLRALGVAIDLPPLADGRELRLTEKKGKLVAKFKAYDEPAPAGWLTQKGYFVRVLGATPLPKRPEFELDHVVRSLVTVDRGDAGYVTRTKTNEWCERKKTDASDQLISAGVPPSAVKNALGNVVANPWTIVSLPFQPEYPGLRRWNVNAAQFVYEPGDEAPHPHWDMVLKHLGADLTIPLGSLPWAIDAGIRTGGDYLLCWLAAMFREPLEPLPYLFFFGPENAGKSLFHESASLLMTRGVVDAYKSLSSNSEFNGELANAVLCYIDEKDLAKVDGARQRIKQWVTGKTISIRKMRTNAYDQPNTTHWVQCANKRSFCPVFPGDTRITMARVALPDKDIPKEELLHALRAEAPQFMRTIVDLQLPERRGRLRIPVVETSQKALAAAENACPLEAFMAERCTPTERPEMLLSDFKDVFWKAIGPELQPEWSATKIALNLPDGFRTEKKNGGKSRINVAWRSDYAVAT